MAGNLNVGSINDVGFMPINLAINPEFTINQRGAASPTAATGYNYDRWYYDGSSLLQGIENLNLRATTYVVSWEGSATCSYSLNTAASSSQGSQTYTSITNGGTLTIASVGSNNLWIKFSGTLTGLTKVSVVPSSTKSPFLPRQYQQELALCQRYYEVVSVPYYAAQAYYSAGAGCFYGAGIKFAVTKRTSPSMPNVSSGSGAWVIQGVALFSASQVQTFVPVNPNADMFSFYQTRVAGNSTPTSGSVYNFEGIGPSFTASAEL